MGDSLCICQDDAEDWACESSRMVDVCSNAYIIIAADRSDDCNKGCFHIRRDRPAVTIDLPGGLGAVYATTLFQTEQDALYTPHKGEFRHEPLSTRGWALQERVLATRIVHYNSKQLYYECAAGILAEDGSYIPSRLSNLRELRCTETDPHGITRVLITWYSLLYSFVNRKLTKPTDKLSAMSGLARLVQKRTNAEYVAGLWSNSLIEGIAWEALGRGEPVSQDEHIEPSWSWASYTGIAIHAGRNQTAISEVQDWHVDLKQAENPFGEVTSAWIRIQGPVAPLTPSSPEKCGHEAQFHRVGTPRLKVWTPYTENEEGHRLNLEYNRAEDVDAWRGSNLQVLLLHEYKTIYPESSVAPKYTIGLVIRSEGAGQMGKMQRVGTIDMSSEEGLKIKGDKSNWMTMILV